MGVGNQVPLLKGQLQKWAGKKLIYLNQNKDLIQLLSLEDSIISKAIVSNFDQEDMQYMKSTSALLGTAVENIRNNQEKVKEEERLTRNLKSIIFLPSTELIFDELDKDEEEIKILQDQLQKYDKDYESTYNENITREFLLLESQFEAVCASELLKIEQQWKALLTECRNEVENLKKTYQEHLTVLTDYLAKLNKEKLIYDIPNTNKEIMELKNKLTELDEKFYDVGKQIIQKVKSNKSKEEYTEIKSIINHQDYCFNWSNMTLENIKELYKDYKTKDLDKKKHDLQKNIKRSSGMTCQAKLFNNDSETTCYDKRLKIRNLNTQIEAKKRGLLSAIDCKKIPERIFKYQFIVRIAKKIEALLAKSNDEWLKIIEEAKKEEEKKVERKEKEFIQSECSFDILELFELKKLIDEAKDFKFLKQLIDIELLQKIDHIETVRTQLRLLLNSDRAFNVASAQAHYLFYGAPGTGKSEFTGYAIKKYIEELSDRELQQDLLDNTLIFEVSQSYYTINGQVTNGFQTDIEIILAKYPNKYLTVVFDEIDLFIRKRIQNNLFSIENSKVATLLTFFDSCKQNKNSCSLIGTTNFEKEETEEATNIKEMINIVKRKRITLGLSHTEKMGVIDAALIREQRFIPMYVQSPTENQLRAWLDNEEQKNIELQNIFCMNKGKQEIDSHIKIINQLKNNVTKLNGYAIGELQRAIINRTLNKQLFQTDVNIEKEYSDD